MDDSSAQGLSGVAIVGGGVCSTMLHLRYAWQGCHGLGKPVQVVVLFTGRGDKLRAQWFRTMLVTITIVLIIAFIVLAGHTGDKIVQFLCSCGRTVFETTSGTSPFMYGPGQK
jgi:hypothetical protein